MTDAGHISTSSTGEEPPINTFQNIQKNQMIQSWRNITSKRFKNLVECYPCTVEDCQILFESKMNLINTMKHIRNYLNANFLDVKNLL